jgi:hypothetical protein
MMNLDLRTELEEAFDWDEDEVQIALEKVREIVVHLQESKTLEQNVPAILRQKLSKDYLPFQIEPLLKYFFRGALSYKEQIEA